MVRLGSEDDSIVGITAAMPSGTGLSHLARNLPAQFFDVGIAEEHAVLFAAGLASRGIKPVCAIYSTFLQRAYDPIIHDVCLQNLPVVFTLDRAGLSPNDGPTHHGLFDIAYLRCVPESVVMQPADEDELVDMLWTALQAGRPMFIRYPKGPGMGIDIKDRPEALEVGKAKVLREGDDVWFWALGPWVSESQVLADRLEARDSISAGVVNARFAKPLDLELLASHAASCRLIITMEDHTATGGFGSAVIEALQDLCIQTPVMRIGWPDKFIAHGSSVGELRRANGLDTETLYTRIRLRLQEANARIIGTSW
jgi:1-deoxy-D-xylulose-5-phosphate synthase